jgi:hypothetical protein
LSARWTERDPDPVGISGFTPDSWCSKVTQPQNSRRKERRPVKDALLRGLFGRQTFWLIEMVFFAGNAGG